jgi:hypothetical protein
MRIILESVVARRACVPSADEPADLRYGKMGVLVAGLSRGRDRQAKLRGLR